MHKTLPGLLLALTTTLLASCAPTTVDPAQHKALYPNEPFHVGETWRVTARGGDYNETYDIAISVRELGGYPQGVYWRGQPASITLGLAQNATLPHLAIRWFFSDRLTASCVFSIPQGNEWKTLYSGRYARSLAAEQAYLKTGATEGTGPCTLERVR